MESFDFPSRRMESQAAADRAFALVLKEMLAANETITARAVAAKVNVEGLKHASSITRDTWRQAELSRFQVRQVELRLLIEKVDHQSKSNLIARLAKAEFRITELENQLELLTAAFRALIQIVGELGGMAAWRRFFDGYQEVVDRLRAMGALPRSTVSQIQDDQ